MYSPGFDDESVRSGLMQLLQDGKALSLQLEEIPVYRLPDYIVRLSTWANEVYKFLMTAYVSPQHARRCTLPRTFNQMFPIELQTQQALKAHEVRLAYLAMLLSSAASPDTDEKATTVDILISWSKAVSKDIATEFYKWLPEVLPGVRPWISHKDIDKGKDWFRELQGFLAQAKQCVIFVTRDNVRSPWLYYESGAISVSATDTMRICPYLVGLDSSIISDGPLGKYMATESTKDDTLRLIMSLNKVLPNPHDENLLKGNFESHWPEYEGNLKKATSAGSDSTHDFTETDTDKLAGHKMSAESRAILLEACRDRNGVILKARSSSGLTLSTNGKDFVGGQDARGQAMWMQGLTDLQTHRLIEAASAKNEVFRVTGLGFKVAELLKP
jgi:hypothetical protein